ncbi:MAG: hypothetical protein HQK53_02520 [Oligoflexia bacterium]|nr:hypothetical protein [Oligoflexia bacterium]
MQITQNMDASRTQIQQTTEQFSSDSEILSVLNDDQSCLQTFRGINNLAVTAPISALKFGDGRPRITTGQTLSNRLRLDSMNLLGGTPIGNPSVANNRLLLTPLQVNWRYINNSNTPIPKTEILNLFFIVDGNNQLVACSGTVPSSSYQSQACSTMVGTPGSYFDIGTPTPGCYYNNSKLRIVDRVNQADAVIPDLSSVYSESIQSVDGLCKNTRIISYLSGTGSTVTSLCERFINILGTPTEHYLSECPGTIVTRTFINNLGASVDRKICKITLTGGYAMPPPPNAGAVANPAYGCPPGWVHPVPDSNGRNFFRSNDAWSSSSLPPGQSFCSPGTDCWHPATTASGPPSLSAPSYGAVPTDFGDTPPYACSASFMTCTQQANRCCQNRPVDFPAYWEPPICNTHDSRCPYSDSGSYCCDGATTGPCTGCGYCTCTIAVQDVTCLWQYGSTTSFCPVITAIGCW